MNRAQYLKARYWALQTIIISIFTITLTACEENRANAGGPINTGGAGHTDSDGTANTETFETADGIKGGQMYSQFWASETGFSLANSKLENQEQLDRIVEHSDFYRCKQCHGWDRLGREGGYSDRAPSATRPNVADLDLARLSESLSETDLFEAIKTGSGIVRRDIAEPVSDYDPEANSTVGDRMPDYGQILTDEQIWNIVKYLKTAAVDTTSIYNLTLGDGVYPNRERSFTELGLDGDANHGDEVYLQYCASCHGDDGTMLLVDGGEYTVGAHSRKKPYEDQHKVKFGHLGSIMGPVLRDASTEDIRDLFKALADSDRYPD